MKTYCFTLHSCSGAQTVQADRMQHPNDTGGFLVFERDKEGKMEVVASIHQDELKAWWVSDPQ